MLTLAVWVLYPLVPFFFSGNESLSVLDTWFPFDQTVSPRREFIYIIESIMILYMGYGLTIINVYFMTMVAAVSTQINVLKSSLINLKSISRCSVDNRIDVVPYNMEDRINDEMERLFRLCLMAVSYTHLDVYKRQWLHLVFYLPEHSQ